MIYKDTKRNTWYFRVYKKNEYGVNKQHTRSGFKTKKDAKDAEVKFLQEKSINEPTFNMCNNVNNDTNIIFEDLYKEYLLNIKQKLKPKSFIIYLNIFEKHILPFFGKYKINEISHKSYMEFKDVILQKNFSYKYNSSIHICMVNILNYAIDFYDLKINIASKIGNFKKHNYVPKVEFWSYEEFKKFINVVDEFEYYVLYHTLYFTGARIGELLALNWNDFKDNCIDINKTLSRGGIHENNIITTPKTKSSVRLVSLDDATIKLLCDLKKQYKTTIGFNNSWFIFGGLKNLSRTTITTKKNNYCKLAKVKQIKIHDFRHSHASHLLSCGTPITAISKRLGHKENTTTLNTYSHLMPQDEDKIITLLNNLNK